MFYASKLIEILKVEHCSFVFAESHCHNKLLWVFFNNSMAKIIFMFSLYQIYISKWSMHNAGTCSNHTSTPLTQTASSTMENIRLNITYYMLQLDPVTGSQTLTDTLTDAACTSQLKCYLAWISAFHTWRICLCSYSCFHK